MSLLHFDNPGEIQFTRWVARGLSLLFIGFVLFLLVLNEDFRNSPTLPTIIAWILALSMLIAWRWERAGGLLTLLLSLVLLLSLLVQWSGMSELMTPTWQLALIGVSLFLPFLIIGWLFFSVGRQSQLTREPMTENELTTAPDKSYRIYVIIGLLGLLAIIFFALSFFFPVQQQVEFSEDLLVPTNYKQLIDDLRAHGAVVGQGKAPVEHPLFSVPGVELTVDGEVVQAFEYTDVAAATTDASAIYYGENASWDDINWKATPHFYQAKNLLVLYVGNDEGVVILLEMVFGPPFGEG